jgi:hypothetical protein
MKRPVQFILTLLVTTFISGPAFAAISFSDDFESYPIYEGGDATDLGGGWTLYVNVFGNFSACDSYLYGYGPFPTPNGPDVSNIVAGSDGNALNAFSNYGDEQHGNGNCLETNVFQERIVSASDIGSYTFLFQTEVPGDLGAGVETYAFIKLIDSNNFNTLIFEKVSTVSAGGKSITVILDESAEGQILQWGFANVASNYLPSGRWYDNVTFAPTVILPPGPAPEYEGVPVPLWAYFLMGGLILLVGGLQLQARRKT